MDRNRFPWLTHLMPLLSIAFAAAVTVYYWPKLFHIIPSHFDYRGFVDGYSSKTIFAATMLGMLVLFEIFNIFTTRIWMLSEDRKRFNYTVVLWGALSSSMAFIYWRSIVTALMAAPRLDGGTAFGGAIAAFIFGGVVTGLIESRRRYIEQPQEEQPAVETPADVNIPYTEHDVFTWPIVLGFISAAGAVIMTQSHIPAPAMWPPAGILAALAILFFGLSVWDWKIDESGIHLRFKSIPFYEKTWRIDDIQSAEAVSFNPLADFLGWGFKVGVSAEFKGVRTYNMRGNRGLLVKTKDAGYLLGFEHPDYAAAAVKKLKG